MSHSYTLRALLHDVEQQFDSADLYYGHGTDNAHDEARYLVLGYLGLGFEIDDAILDRPLEDDKVETIKQLLTLRISERKPVAYLINEAWFAGLSFYVDERALIPRSPIAELIQEQFLPWVDVNDTRRILDMGTGSGCIAIACAYAFPNAIVDAVDISEDALAVTHKNIERHNLVNRVNPILSDLFNNVGNQQYDLIVANPPYVSVEEMGEIPAEYRREPALGLEAGADGMDIVRRLLRESPAYLNEEGVLVVEVGHSQEAFNAAYPELPVTWLEFDHGGEGVFLITSSDLISNIPQS